MGVKACDRDGCDNILCDICVDNLYVCNSCATEFINKYDKPKTEDEWKWSFRTFLFTNKNVWSALVIPDGYITGNDFLSKYRD